ncbi:MAG: diacylglycerol kinase family protein [Candidatus Aminicenantes bacterium]|nr:diacylglycerol kinase family protein [Candidatus Aminicenantes bacterium]
MEPMLVLFNPSSNQGRAAGKRASLQAALDHAGLKYTFVVAQSVGHLRRVAREAGRTHALIVGAGGDSTYSLIAGEILAGRLDAVLGMIPLGSSNDVPREFGLDRMDKAIGALKEGRTRAIDLGVVRTAGLLLGYFLGQANVGLGAVVNRRVARMAERRWKTARWQWAAGYLAIRAAIWSREVPLRLEIEGGGRTTSGKFLAAVFSNIRYWATGKVIVPEARTDDGILDLCLIKPCPFIRLAEIYRLAGKGRHGRLRQVEFQRASSFHLRSRFPMEIQADGEILGTIDGRTKFDDLQIGIVPNALKIIG